MILVVFGTTELIKLAPVLVRLDERAHPYVLATTGQQVEQIPRVLRQFGLRQPDIWLARGNDGRDLRSNSDIPGWFLHVARSVARVRSRLRRTLAAGTGRPLVLVHGDTMTTLLGALLGRVLGTQVAHVEGGLRSFHLLDPFPEELNRRLASRLAHITYAPSAWATSNLRGRDAVDTGCNTMRDSLALVTEGAPGVAVPQEAFGIVSLHRFELLNNRRLLTETLELLADAATFRPLLFIDHPVTAAAIERFQLGGFFNGVHFVRIARLPFLVRSRAPRGAYRHGCRREPGGVVLPGRPVPRTQT